MQNRFETPNKPMIPAEYVVIGGGPAGICAVAKLFGAKIPGKNIVWVDPQFNVGDFGTKLSVGSSVPGNTAVESYQKVNHAIYNLIHSSAPTGDEKTNFKINGMAPDTTCALSVAAEPLQHISTLLCGLVNSIKGNVCSIQETKEGLEVEITATDDTKKYKLLAKRVILAIGATPKTITLPNHITAIDPNIAFIKSELQHYLNENPQVKTVAVIGSSHSAALATMHLLEAGITVKQLMNKEYKFATGALAENGTPYTQFDNTGLKGEVAHFTRELLKDNSKMNGKWECYMNKNIEDLPECTHAVICIGYTPRSSLKINDLSLSTFHYDKQSTRIMHANGTPIPGVFGMGVAFPLEVKALSGEIELGVGVGKFWANIDEKILSVWEKHPADFFYRSIPHAAAQAIRYNGVFSDLPEPAPYPNAEPNRLGVKI